jgi:hypothetical protein
MSNGHALLKPANVKLFPKLKGFCQRFLTNRQFLSQHFLTSCVCLVLAFLEVDQQLTMMSAIVAPEAAAISVVGKGSVCLVSGSTFWFMVNSSVGLLHAPSLDGLQACALSDGWPFSLCYYAHA